MATREEQSLAIARKIFQKEMELESLREEYKRFVSDGKSPPLPRRRGHSPSTEESAPAVGAEPAVVGTATERIFGHFEQAAPKVLRPQEVAESVNLDLKLVQNVILRLANDGRLEKVSRGMYRFRSREKMKKGGTE